MRTFYYDVPGIEQDYFKAQSRTSKISLDYSKAMSWFVKSSDQGHGNDQYAIEKLYRGVSGPYQRYGLYYEIYLEEYDRATLDVVIAGQWIRPELTLKCKLAIITPSKELSLEYLQEPPPYTSQENDTATHVVQTWNNSATAQLNTTTYGFLGATEEKDGKGVYRDYKAAMIWFLKAAEQGHAVGQCNIGFRYINGFGVTQDYSTAFGWYRKAADQGNARGQAQSVVCTPLGAGVPHSTFQAKEWYLKAVQGGHVSTHLHPLRIAAVPGVVLDIVVAGQVVRTGTILPEDSPNNDIFPAEYLSQDVSRTPPSDSTQLSNAKSSSTSTTTSTTTTTRAKGTSRITRTANTISVDTPTSSEINGTIPYAHPYVSIYHNLLTPPSAPRMSPAVVDLQSIQESMFSASLGDTNAQVKLGSMYSDGQGVPQVYGAAMSWYMRAADKGDVAAQYTIGCMHEHGHGFPKDYSKAFEWYSIAADQGDPRTCEQVVSMYDFGIGVPQSDFQAVHWYLKASKEGHAVVQFNLANINSSPLNQLYS
ncbi:MAG: hypothetical protein J3R72DRAFT_495065 [Linnemannia gamsii]|nr:MAG: hypothetical protein J3R72DRAFT_495065 [Linnemannia gamsii]